MDEIWRLKSDQLTPSPSVETSVFHHGVIKQVNRGRTRRSGHPRYLAQMVDGRVRIQGYAAYSHSKQTFLLFWKIQMIP